MADLLELADNELNVCWKAFPCGQNGTINSGQVATLARSEPFDARNNDTHPVERNSVWAALLGRSDGARDWQWPFTTPVSFLCTPMQRICRFHVLSRIGRVQKNGAGVVSAFLAET